MTSRIRNSLGLFAAGFFFGGVVDHVIFALRREGAPYGFHLGVLGNWLMAGFDAALTALLLLFAWRRPSRSEH